MNAIAHHAMARAATREPSTRPTGMGSSPTIAPVPIDELALAERLISYDTSNPEGVIGAMGYLKGWLEGQGISHRAYDVNGLPAIVAAGDGELPAGAGEPSPATLIWNAHVDVVPARREQFSPWSVDGRLYGRGAYDMKGALA